MATTNEDILEAFLRHQVYLLRFGAGLSKEMQKILDESEAALLSKITKFAHDNGNAINSNSWRNLLILRNEIKELRNNSWNNISESLYTQLNELAETDAAFVKYAIESPLPVVLNLALPSVSLLKSIVESRPFEGKLLKEHIAKLADDDVARIANAVKLGMTQGESMQQMVNRVVGTKSLKGLDGETRRTRNQIEAIIRTSVMHVSNHVHDEIFMNNSDVITKERFHATLDGRTTPVCIDADGKIFDVGMGPRPPLHIRCRSVRIPVVDGEILGERPARTATEAEFRREYDKLGLTTSYAKYRAKRMRETIGRVPAETTYIEFLNKQPRWFVEDVLGKTRAKLFLDGGLKIDQFVIQSGRELTIKELRERYPDIFKKVGIT